MRRRYSASLSLGIMLCILGVSGQVAHATPELVRAVVLVRHGVRPPTKSADVLRAVSDRPWPTETEWGAAPGALTPHGALALKAVALGLAREMPALSEADHVFIYADSADQRTRATARVLAEFWPGPGRVAYEVGVEGRRDPIFSGAPLAQCHPPLPPRIMPWRHAAAVTWAFERLQAVVAPNACAGGEGRCLIGEDNLTSDASGVRLEGPGAEAASLAESLLLEYENGLEGDALGFGRLHPEDLPALLAIHNEVSRLTRQDLNTASAKAAFMASSILAFLRDQPEGVGLGAPPNTKLLILVGHDTNMSAVAGVFDLALHLPLQPDATPPGGALSFELWRDTGRDFVRVRALYQTPDEVRRLAATPLHTVAIASGLCPSGQPCPLSDLSVRVAARLCAVRP